MSPVTMSARERRTVTLALAVLVPSLGWVFVGKPLRAALAGTNDRVAIERDALSRERAAIAGAARSPARKRFADSAMAAAASRVFTGANDVAAGATLVSYLGEVARRTHVWLASAATQPGATTAPRAGGPPAAGGRRAAPGGRGEPTGAEALPEGLGALRVELRAESDFQGVLEFLDALERGGKVVNVERLDLARVLRAGGEDNETLSITATVVGYAMNTRANDAPASGGRGRGGAPGAAGSPGAPGAPGAPGSSGAAMTRGGQ